MLIVSIRIHTGSQCSQRMKILNQSPSLTMYHSARHDDGSLFVRQYPRWLLALSIYHHPSCKYRVLIDRWAYIINPGMKDHNAGNFIKSCHNHVKFFFLTASKISKMLLFKSPIKAKVKQETSVMVEILHLRFCLCELEGIQHKGQCLSYCW